MTTSTPTVSISQAQLKAALTVWEELHRRRGTRTYEETLRLSVDQVTTESAAYLFKVLQGGAQS